MKRPLQDLTETEIVPLLRMRQAQKMLTGELSARYRRTSPMTPVQHANWTAPRMKRPRSTTFELWAAGPDAYDSDVGSLAI